MDGAVYCDGVKLQKQEFNKEVDFENVVKTNSKKLFGSKTIYLDTKKKIGSVSLGGSIPDGILFDLEDLEDIRFYLVEVELEKHPFYQHIFPQITKFFAFYKDPTSQNNLIEKVYSFITDNEEIKSEFDSLLEGRELYKSIKDAVENNQEILLIIDKEKLEIYEAQEVYTDTWDKLVIPKVLSQYKKGEREVLILEPDYLENELFIEQEEKPEEDKKVKVKYFESYHLEGVDPSINYLYDSIKKSMLNLDPEMEFNPQKYYISLRKNRNFAYLAIRKKKIRIAVMLPYSKGLERINHHKLREFTKGIQGFYGRPSFEITLEDDKNLEEVLDLLKEAYQDQVY